MKHLHLWVIVCACVFIGVSSGIILRLFTTVTDLPHTELTSQLNPSDPKYQDVMCGPVSLFVALGLLGISSSQSDIASKCKVTHRGVTFAELESIANSDSRVRARIQRLNWDELSLLDGVAVLFVKGDHFITVDPREKRYDIIKSVGLRVYEPKRPAQWWSREKLEGVWDGETLVISSQIIPDHEIPLGSLIDWDKCFLDQGIVKDTPVVNYRFSFCNIGNKDLIVYEVQTSCGCLDYNLSKKQLSPGESAHIEVRLDTKNKEGYVEQYVTVKTNELRNPISMLTMAGGIPRARVISSDAISFEDLPRGNNTSKKFYVADPGFNGAKILDTRFVPNPDSNVGEHLNCSISYELIGKDTGRVASLAGFHTKSDDYEVQVSFEANKMCPLGAYQGVVYITLEVNGVLKTHKVFVEGVVVQDVRPVPRVALITLDPEGTGSVSIQLHSYSKQEIRVVKMWSDGKNSLKVRPEDESESANKKYVITAQTSDIVAGTAPVNQTVVFMLEGGAEVSVPVALFMPPKTN
ncbi:DUF1573 domain-containing protein [Gimesia aquarii]|uniref:Peptidase C39 domain-containing protein n=1 Tax=Gimesia aquarii TaxID=2527964 RepID=A0A517X0N1_9PLAN|nr:DUF1573 domain-containing protein [Gimesia aquarii]QDU11044.1 hypothetical protein V202x_44600 [Gimesia aquarii]